uniref:DBH-like monooxygenase protein 1 n=1 Tax=Styela clava TaxID=7725 RepID=UPI00193ACECB|nr:DBH-like monooxygenase protein 1 [Styela clava]
MKLIVFFSLCVMSVNGHQATFSTEDFSQRASLANGYLKLYWKANKDTITMEVHGKTTGWIGIGFSPHGGMNGADIIVGWIKNGTTYITDRYGIENGFPPRDSQQDVKLIMGKECDGWTMIRFKRSLESCDQQHDRSITADTQRVIWAFGETDPIDEDLSPPDIHRKTTMGSLSLILVGDISPSRNNIVEHEPGTKTILLTNNKLKIPVVDTYYHCHLIEIPVIPQKHHIIKARPIITKGNEMLVHHMILYQCGTDLKNRKDLNENGTMCYSPDMPAHYSTCGTLVSAFAIGGTDFHFPPEVGHSFGGKKNSRYFQLQIHYDNPMLKNDIIDSSGVELTYTAELRKYDAGLIVLGNTIDGFEHFIPPNAQQFKTVGHCQSRCWKGAMEFSKTPSIKIFSTLLHTHITGRSVTVRHYRNGTEQSIISQDKAYDYNYQEMRFHKSMPEIFPTDHVTVECSYNTTGNKNIVLGGLGSQQEMCAAFAFYYPKIDLSQCTSNPVAKEIYSFFNISKFSIAGINGLYDVQVTEPEKYTGMTGMHVINKLMTWNDQTIGEFWKREVKMTHSQICAGQHYRSESFTFEPPEVSSPYIEPEKLCTNLTTERTIVKSKIGCSSSRTTSMHVRFLFAWLLLTTLLLH